MRPLRLLCALLLTLWAATLAATEIVHFDLNQDGAATLVIQELADGRKAHILIDTGRASTRADRGGGKVRALLNERGISELDAVIVTHIDADHASGVRSLIESSPAPNRGSTTTVDARGPPIRIRQVVWPGIIKEGTGEHRERKEFWSAFLEEAKTLQLPLFTPETGAAAQLQPLGIEVQRMAAAKMRTSNDTSLILTVRDTASNVSHLLTGDMTRRSFAELQKSLPESVEILHAPHHGADPVVRQLLQQTKPRFLVVSANRGNRFGHPPALVLRQIARLGHQEDLRERDRKWQAAAEMIIRARVIDELTTYTSEWRRPGSPVPPRRRTATSGDPQAPAIADDQRVLNEAQATWRRLAPRASIFGLKNQFATVSANTFAPLFYDQVLVTGEVGDVSFIDGKLGSETGSASDVFLKEMIWHELRYLTDAEVERYPQWPDTQAFLALRAASRFAEVQRAVASPETLRPLWLSDIERIVVRVKGWNTFTTKEMDAALIEWCQPEAALEFGRARVSNDRWRQLENHRKLMPDGDAVERSKRTSAEIDEPLRARAQRRLGGSQADPIQVNTMWDTSLAIARELRDITLGRLQESVRVATERFVDGEYARDSSTMFKPERADRPERERIIPDPVRPPPRPPRPPRPGRGRS